MSTTPGRPRSLSVPPEQGSSTDDGIGTEGASNHGPDQEILRTSSSGLNAFRNRNRTMSDDQYFVTNGGKRGIGLMSASTIEKFVHDMRIILRISLLVYYITTTSFCLSFQPPESAFQLIGYWGCFTVMDYVADLFFIWDAVDTYRHAKIKWEHIQKLSKKQNRTLRENLAKSRRISAEGDRVNRQGSITSVASNDHQQRRRHALNFTSSYHGIKDIDTDTSIELAATSVHGNRSSSIAPAPAQLDAFNNPANSSISSKKQTNDTNALLVVAAHRAHSGRVNLVIMILKIALLLPYEVAAYAAGFQYFQWLRIIRFYQLIFTPGYWNSFTEDILTKYDITSNAETQRALLLNILMMVTGHVAACAYHGIGLLDNNANSWLTFSNLAVFDPLTNHLALTASISYRYLQSLYFSIQTLTTVGFGDIVAHTFMETCFCIVYSFIAAFFMAFITSNFELLISNNNSAKINHLTKVARFEKYAKLRALPPDVIAKVQAYYDYQWKVLGGMDEQEMLSAIPSNLRHQMHQVMIGQLLNGVDIIKTLKPRFISALCLQCETRPYAPGHVILAEGGLVQGLFIVLSGQLEVSSSASVSRRDGSTVEDNNLTSGWILVPGQYYGLSALAQTHPSECELRAKTFLEIVYLDGQVFLETVRNEFHNTKAFKAFMKGFRPRSNDALDHSDGVNRVVMDSSKNKSGIFHRRTIATMSAENNHGTSTSTKNEHKTAAEHYYDSWRHPESMYRYAWDSFVLLIFIFYCFSIPMLLTGSLNPSFASRYLALLALGYIADIFMAITAIVNMYFFLVLVVDDGMTVTADISFIFNKFIENEPSPVALMVSLFPLDIILALLLDTANVIPVVRVLKFIHLRQLSHYFKRFSTALYHMGIMISFEVARSIQLYFFIFLVCHFVACCWLLIADVSTEIFEFPTNWRQQETIHPNLVINNNAFFGWTPYLRSYYWSISTMSSIAYSDILASNAVEIAAVIVIMFFGVQIVSGLDAGLASMIASLGRDKREFRRKVDIVKGLMAMYDVGPVLEWRILRYYEYTWDRYNGIDQEAVLDSLPKDLRGAVTYSFVRNIVRNVSFFNKCEESFMELIFSSLIPRIYLIDDPLWLFNELSDEFFIIENGSVAITDAARHKVFKTLTAGETWCEEALLSSTPVKGETSAVALSYCDVFVLQQHTFQSIAEHFPESMAAIKPLLEERINRNDRCLKEKLKRRPSLIDAVAFFQGTSISWATGSNKMVGLSTTRLTGSVSWERWLHPDSLSRGLWSVFTLTGLIYLMVIAVIRFVITIPDDFYIAEYFLDCLFIVDSILVYSLFPVYDSGAIVFETEKLNERYMKSGRVYRDVIAAVPFDLLAFAFVSYGPEKLRFVRALLRFPKITRLLTLPELTRQVETFLISLNFTAFAIRSIWLLVIILVSGLYAGSGYSAFLLKVVSFLTGKDDCLSVYNNNQISNATTGTSHVDPAVLYSQCQYSGTWLQDQMEINRTATNGGSEWDRFTMAFYWAIPTLTKITLSDVPPLNERESLYIAFIEFLGIGLSGAILGAAISLISDVNADTEGLALRMETLECQLGTALHEIPAIFIDKASAYMKTLMSREGTLLRLQDDICQKLPYSLQTQLNSFMKTNRLRDSHVFDGLPDEVLDRLASKLEIRIYNHDDHIIQEGEIGNEIFFLAEGTVYIMKGDVMVMALSDNATNCMFGEAGLFEDVTRSATVVVRSETCICYVITRDAIVEQLRVYDRERHHVSNSFRQIKENHDKRSKSIVNNAQRSEKLLKRLTSQRKLLFVGAERIREQTVWCSLESIRRTLHPQSYYRILWNLLGFLLLVYYAFAIPAAMAFVVGNTLDVYFQYIAVDLMVDVYWIVDGIFKMTIFSCYADKQEEIVTLDGAEIRTIYFSHRHTVIIDALASISLEFFYLIPGLTKISFYILRCNHFLRVMHVPKYSALIEDHLLYHFNWKPRHSLSMVIKASLLFIATAHWISCIYFMIHRYMEPSASLTFAVQDHLASYDPSKGRHTVCDVSVTECYTRTMYFVASTISSIGYGDILPYNNTEIIWEIMVSLIGSFIGAILSAYCSAYLKDLSMTGDMAYKSKIANVKNYMKFRKINPVIEHIVLEQFRFLWDSQRSLGDKRTDIFSDLSETLTLNIAYAMQYSAVEFIPFLMDDFRENVHKRMAAIMKPQMVVLGGPVFNCGDIGDNFFFVSKGVIMIDLIKHTSRDPEANAIRSILAKKHEVHGSQYIAGEQFGEYSMVTRLGLRLETATALMPSVIMGIEKSDFWKLLQVLDYETRALLVADLLSVVGNDRHLPLPNGFASRHKDCNSDAMFFKSLDSYARRIMDELTGRFIIVEGAEDGSEQDLPVGDLNPEEDEVEGEEPPADQFDQEHIERRSTPSEPIAGETQQAVDNDNYMELMPSDLFNHLDSTDAEIIATPSET